jgi:hypothetical protein
MEEKDDARDLEHKISQASRIASSITDQTTIERLTAWIDELKRRLQKRRAVRRAREETRARAREIWEQNGRPTGRDEEFWLRAESEVLDRQNSQR